MDAVLWVPVILIAMVTAGAVYWAYWYGEVRPKKDR